MSKNLNENMLGKVSGGKYVVAENGGKEIFGEGRDAIVKQEFSGGGKKINLIYANDAQGNTERENFLKKAQQHGAVGYAGKENAVT